MNDMDKKLKQICEAFCVEGEYDSFEEIKVGNVNHTYKIKVICKDAISGEKKCKWYVAQELNTYVFKDPVHVMENIDKVTRHIQLKTPGRTALIFNRTSEGKTYVYDSSVNEGEGAIDGFWRMYNFITSSTYNTCDDMDIVHNAGEAFGEFQMQLADFDAAQLYDTIPDFHNTRKRFEKLEADAAADPCGKVSQVKAELEWLMSVKELACTLTDMRARGELPLRVTHNDTKINNVLFEKDGTKPLVVIDLDTVMPGLVGADFGDAIRFAANYVQEDCPDADKSGLNMDIFRAFTEGFLRYTANALTQAEIDTLALSSFVLAVELATRFLDDYILGSPYFKIDYPEHNLVRTRCQAALAKDMLGKMDEMKLIVKECAQKYRA